MGVISGDVCSVFIQNSKVNNVKIPELLVVLNTYMIGRVIVCEQFIFTDCKCWPSGRSDAVVKNFYTFLDSSSYLSTI